MLNLYYVVTYDFRGNDRARFILTAPTHENAMDQVKDHCMPDEKVDRCSVIYTDVPNPSFQEL